MPANWGAIAIEIESEDAAGKFGAYRMGGGLPGIVAVIGRHTSTTARTGGVTPAQFTEWAPVVLGGSRNIAGWAISFQRLLGMGGSVVQYTDTPANIVTTGTGLDSDIWMQWRGVHYFETVGIAAYMKARGMEPLITFWASNLHSTKGSQTPFVRWEEDAQWTTMLAEVTAFASAAAAEGFVGLGIDGELYSYGATADTGWGQNYSGRTCTVAEAHDFARLRGEQMADAILAEMPGAVWWSYATDLPGSNRALAHGSDTFYANNTSVDFLAGICSRSGWSRVHIVDPSFYKGTQVWGNDSFANWCDAIRKCQMDQASTICANLTESEWDVVAPKLTFPPFIWLTPGPAGEVRLSYSQADVAIRAAVYATAGDWWWLYTQGAPGQVLEDASATGTGYDYDEYEDLFQAYAQAGYGDEVVAPVVTITTNSGADFSTPSPTLALAGTAVGGAASLDSGGKHAIHYVQWFNITLGASGQCQFSFVNDTANWDPSSPTAAPQTGARLLWHINWSKGTTGDSPIPLAAGLNLIYVIATDAKGNTAVDTIIVTRSAVLEAAGSGSAQDPTASVSVNAAVATVATTTGSAPLTQPSPVPATATAAANSPTNKVATNPAATLVDVAGQPASVSTNTSGIAQVASVTAAAQTPTSSVRSPSDLDTVAAAAQNASITTTAPGQAEAATGTASANNATASVSASGSNAAATAVAEVPRPDVSLGAQSASITTVNTNAVVGGSTVGQALAETADVTATAFDAVTVQVPIVYATAESADLLVSAESPGAAVSTPSESADVVTVADDISASLSISAEVAPFTGAAETPSLGSEGFAEVASATASADDPGTAVSVPAEDITILGVAEDAGSDSQVGAEVAEVVALAENTDTGQTHDVLDVQPAEAIAEAINADGWVYVTAESALGSAASENPVALIGMFLALFFEGGSGSGLVNVHEGSDA